MTRDPDALLGDYDKDACRVCGRCLRECPVMELPEADARREMEELRAGRDGNHVLARCETCLACNLVCPNAANPAALFRARFEDAVRRDGLPAWSPYFQPHESPNYRGSAVAWMRAEDRARLESWKSLEPVEEFFYPGCNLSSMPSLLSPSILGDLPIRGGMEVCCGETLFRMGMLDRLRENTARLDAWLARLGAKRMYLLCTAGVTMFRHVLPRYGLASRIEVVPYLPILRERVRAGVIRLPRSLDMNVTLQESCYGKVMGDDYMDAPREILAAAGVRVVEMAHRRERSRCCGIGGGFPPKSGYDPARMILAARRVLADARATGASAIATYCGGCWMMLSAMRPFLPTTMPVYHVVELLRMAMGETLDRPVWRLMAANLVGPIVHQFPKRLSRRRVRKAPIPVGPW
jgi:Fe-S oxidoreductase